MPPANIEIQILIMAFFNSLYKFKLKKIRLKNTYTKPIVCVKRIKKLNNAQSMKLFLAVFLIHLRVYNKLKAENKNNIEYKRTSCE